MRPLRYSINVTLDGCCDHREIVPDEELHRRASETIAGLSNVVDLKLVGQQEYASGAVAMRYQPRTSAA